MNRMQLQRLAERRVAEALILLSHGEWSGAYYLVGYAVELGLKSCILAHIERSGVIFQEKSFGEQCWTHDLVKLAKLADLERIRAAQAAGNPAFRSNWDIVKDWNETARYIDWSESAARELCNAVTDPINGVFSWIKSHW